MKSNINLLYNGQCYIEINGMRHWVKISSIEKKTIPIVIIHGGPGGNTYVFERTVGNELEKFSTVIYYEQRGCGRSESPRSNEYSVEAILDDIEKLIVSLGYDKVNLLGYSFGGELALEFALRKAKLIDKLILQAPSVMSDFERIARIQFDGFKQITSKEVYSKIEEIINSKQSILEKYDSVWSLMDADIVDRLLFLDQKLAKMNRDMWKESGLINTGLIAESVYKRNRSRALLDDLENVDINTLIIVGLYDRNVGVDLVRDIHSKLPNSKLEIFEKSAHFPDIEETERYASLVKKFILDS